MTINATGFMAWATLALSIIGFLTVVGWIVKGFAQSLFD